MVAEDLPAEDVEQSFAAPGAEAYFAMSGDDVLGGAIITAGAGVGNPRQET